MSRKKNRSARKPSGHLNHNGTGGRPDLISRTSFPEPNIIISCIGIAFLSLFLFIAPFQTALFNGYPIQYEYDILAAVAWTAACFLIIAVYWVFRWRINGIQSWLLLLMWALPFAYLLSGLTAVSPYSNGKMTLLYVMYAMLFSMGLYFCSHPSGSRWIKAAIMGSGYLIVIYCFLNMFGHAYYRDAVMEDQGFRLTSVFQYANAYASYLIAILIGCLYGILSSRRWYVTGLHALMLVPLVISFLLTLSRGGIVVLPLILLAVLPFLSLIRQLCFFIYLGLGLAASFLITDRIREISLEMLHRVMPIENRPWPETVSLTDPLALKGWLTLLPVTFITAALVVLFQRYVKPVLERKLERLMNRSWSSFVLPAGLLIAGGIGFVLLSQLSSLPQFLPEALQQRLETINFRQHSVVERFMMFGDSLKLFADRPLLGGGGGAWEALYTSYQGSPYIPRQVHSYFLEYLTETGLVGALFLGGLLVLLMIYFIKHVLLDKSGDPDRFLLFYFIPAAILIHSMMDFEMSFAYLAALVFLCLGGMAAAVSSEVPLKARRWWSWPADKRWGMAIPAALSAAALIVFVVSINDMRANRHFYAFTQQIGEGQIEAALSSLDTALQARPDHPFFVMEKVNVLNQSFNQTQNTAFLQEAGEILQQLEAKEPYNRELFEERYEWFLRQNDKAGALTVVDSRLETSRWGISMYSYEPRHPYNRSINWYERKIRLGFELGVQAGEDNQPELQEMYWEGAKQAYAAVQDRMRELEELPEEQLHEPFGVSEGMSLAVGTILSSQGAYGDAIEVWKPALNDNWENPQQREMTRRYLAAALHLGQADEELYDQFVGEFPEEREQIEELRADPA